MIRTGAALRAWGLTLLLIPVMVVPASIRAEQPKVQVFETDTLLAVAREVMESAPFCALITIDQAGQFQVRAMEPFPPEEDMVVWLGTNRKSRKVEAIRTDPRVALYYADPQGSGYVTIAGTARLVDDPEKIAHYWKPKWEAYYPDREKTYILIAVTPEKLDVLSYKHGIANDPETWRAPSVEFKDTNTDD